MFFVLVCAVHLLWLLLAYSFVYLKKPVAAWQYVNAVLCASVLALPVAYKFSFGG